MAQLTMNTIVSIGYLGCKRCYLNLSREEAIARYLQSEEKESLDSHEDVREFSFEDEFSAYDVYEK